MTDPIVAEESSCANCGYPLARNFCGNCGQQDKEVRCPFLYFLHEMLRVMFELDGRAYRTVYYLLTKPGFLAKEYFGGRRTSYSPPLRLFLIISIGFFLMVSTVTSLQSMQSALVEDAEATDDEIPEEVLEQLAEAGVIVDPDGLNLTIDGFEANPDEIPENVMAGLEAAGVSVDPEGLNFTFSGEGATVEDLQEILDIVGSIKLPFLSEESNQNLSTVLVAQTEENFQVVMDDPQGFFLDSLEYITFFMLLLIPLLALIQRLLFIFTRHYYVEHLVLTLHNHAFLIFAFFLSLLVGLVEDLDLPYLSAAFGYIGGALVIWMFVYLYLSLKFYFQRGYFLTGVIFFTTSLIYSIVLGMGIAVFVLLLFILA